MGYANVITPYVAKTLKLLAIIMPLSILVFLSIMAVRAHNEMNNIEFGGKIRVISSSVTYERGIPQQSTPVGK